MIGAVCCFDHRGLAVLRVVVPQPGYVDDLADAEKIDSALGGFESDVPFGDGHVVLGVVVASVGLFVVAFVFRLPIGQRSNVAGVESLVAVEAPSVSDLL